VLDISYETIRSSVFSLDRLSRGGSDGGVRGRATVGIWDEMVVRIAGELMYLWRAVDHEGEVLDMLVQRRRGCRAALRLMRKLLKKQRFGPKLPVTDKLRSYSAAFRRLRLTRPHEQELRKTIGLKTLISRCDDASARCCASSRLDRPSAFSTCTPPAQYFNFQRHLVSRSTLRIFHAEAASHWQEAGCGRMSPRPALISVSLATT